MSSASSHWRRPTGIWVAEKCPKLQRKPMVPASRGMQVIHYGATEEIAPVLAGLAGLALIVNHSDVLLSMLWFMYMLRK